ncbi:hypothetical protein [Chryseobacterium sp. MMS23-Vi53]|uniref:hypothetical protein n=1 Tax=Chryseobacterium sp. MMS23-Vi53 TaxID=3386644 RepID=UPI0039ECB605
MKIRAFYIIAIIFFSIHWAWAQKVKVDFIIKNDSLPKREKINFIYLDHSTNISMARYIGRIKSTGKINDINLAIIFISDKAKKKGANAFKYVDFKNKDGIAEIVLDAYVIDENLKKSNEDFLPKNKIYFFGRDNINRNEAEEYKLNGEIRSIEPFKYAVSEFDKEMIIGKGKAFGTTLKLKPKDSESVFINFTGFGASPNYMPAGGVGISFSGGNVIRMERDTGLLLTHIFAKQE